MKQQQKRKNNKERVERANKFMKEMDIFLENQKYLDEMNLDGNWRKPYQKIKEYTEECDFY